MNEMILYQLDSGETRSTIKVIDLENVIKVDGYDVGKSVKDIFGCSDYEYSMEIDKSELLELILEIDNYFYLFERYKGDYKCFSKIKEWFDENNLKYKYSSWRSGG